MGRQFFTEHCMATSFENWYYFMEFQLKGKIARCNDIENKQCGGSHRGPAQLCNTLGAILSMPQDFSMSSEARALQTSGMVICIELNDSSEVRCLPNITSEDGLWKTVKILATQIGFVGVSASRL